MRTRPGLIGKALRSAIMALRATVADAAEQIGQVCMVAGFLGMLVVVFSVKVSADISVTAIGAIVLLSAGFVLLLVKNILRYGE